MIKDLGESQIDNSDDYQQKQYQHRNKAVWLFVFKHHFYFIS